MKLKPYDLQEVVDYMTDYDVFDDKEWEEAIEGDRFGYLIQLGDNFDVPTMEGNIEGVEFYLLQCTKGKYEIEHEFTCS